MEGGSSSFGNPGGLGGSKNRAFCRGGVDFFWNNPLFQIPLKNTNNSFLFFSPQDDYMEALGKLHMTVTRAYKVGLIIELHNFMII